MIETPCFQQWLGNNQILYARVFPNSELTLKEMRLHIEAIGKLTQGKKYPMLVDLRGAVSFSKEARTFLRSEQGTRHSTAIALLVGNPITRIIDNFFLGFNKPQSGISVKIFSAEDLALAWLERSRILQNNLRSANAESLPKG
ncbi:hypothetical protein WDW89_01310 [Deltaproteobacteria bacterium TL4]